MAATREAAASAPDAAPPEALYAKLRPGPGRAAGEVALHQRARLRGSMVEIVSERGYDAVTVRELARLAGVSTRTFYEHFDSKEACLLDTLDSVIHCAAGHVVENGERGWQQQLRFLLLSLARELERKPQLGRVALVEALSAGPMALRRLRHAEQAFEGLIEDSFDRAPDRVALSPLVVEGIVAGLLSVARARLLAGREQELPGLVDELLEWALCYRSEEPAVLEQLEQQLDLKRTAPGGDDAASRIETNGQAPGDERALILSAMAKLAAAEGHLELTIPRIRAAAGVSRKSFDESFDSAEACFIAALEMHAAHAISHASLAYAEGEDWPEGVHRGIVALCDYIACDPVLTALGFVEIFSLGAEGVRTRERLTAQVVELFHGSAPPEQRPGRLAAEASTGAVWGLIHHHVVSGQMQQLSSVAPTLSYLALAPAIGAPAAMDAIRQVATVAAETSTPDRQMGRGAS